MVCPLHDVSIIMGLAPAVLDPEVVDFDDARMRKLHERMVLTLEGCRLFGKAALAGQNQELLERKRTAAGAIDNTIDHCHPAAPKLFVDEIATADPRRACRPSLRRDCARRIRPADGRGPQLR